jgi:hypothetical protein
MHSIGLLDLLCRLLEHSGTLNHALLDLIPGAEPSAGYLHVGPTFQSAEEAGRYKENLLRQ